MTPNSDNEKLSRLSAYIDGQLNAEESSRFELELENDSELRDLREQYLANGQAIRQLPRFQLPTNFADQVLAQLENDAPPPKLNATTSGQPIVVDRHASRTALGLTAGLAALLLVSFFISPLLTQPTTETVALNTDAKPQDQEPSVEEKTQAADAPNSETTDSAAATMLANSDPVSPRQPRMLAHRPKAMSADGANQRSGVVAAVPPVQQVLLVKFSDAKKTSEERMRVIQKVFSESPSGPIQIEPAQADLDLEREFAVGKETQAMVVIASNAEIKQVVTRLRKQQDVVVRAIPMGGPKVAKGTSAHLLQTYELNQPKNEQRTNQDETADIDPKELESLDRWFGLASEPQSKSLSRFLLLIN